MNCGDRGFPDVTDGVPCCYGSAHNGPGGCTCWEPVHDLEQAPVQVAEPAVRPECCHDCAYRTGSPESLGDGRYGLSDPGELEDFAGRAGKTRFFCHQGSRRVVAWRHPTGAVHPVPEDVRYYDSPVHDLVAYKADGAPQEICAGFAARRRQLIGDG